MAQYGVTPEGFVKKTLQIIKAEKEAFLRSVFGPAINLLPTELLGQLVGISSEAEAKNWDVMEAVYYSQYPDTASGVSLDNVVAITAIKRLAATKGTAVGIAYGTEGTLLPTGSVVSVAGDVTARFLFDQDYTIGPGTNEVQDIDFSAVPDEGSYTLIFDGEQTGSLAFNANAAAIQTALNNLSGLSGVTVSGNYSSGFTVTFAGSDGQKDQPLIVVGANTLENTNIAVVISIVETTPGVLPNVEVNLTAETAGEIPAYAGTLTVIETPLPGWDSFTNPLDAEIGKNVETDAELRLRRAETLATSGSTTVDAIRARLLEIDEVEAARVFENDTNVVDAFGRPPKSFESVVVGGDDQEIWDTIWSVKAAGIETYGTEVGSVEDTQGFTHTVKFSRPTQVPIYIIATLTTDPANFPVGGDEAAKEALAEFGTQEFSIGDDVLYWRMDSPLNAINGILEVDITIGTAPAPVGTSNIPILDDEISQFDTAFITVIVV